MSGRASFGTSVRKAVLAKFGGRCAYCGTTLDIRTMTVDHVHPVHRGGGNGSDNLFPACRCCNHQKSTFTVEEFRGEIDAQSRRALKSGRIRIALRTGVLAITGERATFHFEREGAGA